MTEKFNKIKIEIGEILKIDSDGRVCRDLFECNNLAIDAYKYDSSYIRFVRFDDFMVNTNEEDISSLEEQYLGDIINYAKSIGVSESCVYMLLEYGYSYEDIEDILYEPKCWEIYFNS